MKNLFLFALLALFSPGLMLSGCTPQEPPQMPDSTIPNSPPPSQPDKLTERERRRISITDGRFTVDGGTKPIWMNGVNIPWHNWDDFGDSYDAGWWDGHFAGLHANGVNAARVWISCRNDNNVIIIGADGTVSGVADAHWAALDRFFASAERHGIYIMATIMSFDHFDDRGGSRAAAESWRNMVKSDETVDSYIEHYTIPFLNRYKDNPFLWSIDLMNEPDWVHEEEKCGQLAWEALSRFFARNAAAIRENSTDRPVLITAGMAFPKYNADGPGYEGNKVSDAFLQSIYQNENARLDFWSPHYYDWVGQWYGIPFTSSPFGSRTDGGWGLCASKPAMLAEHPGGGSEGFTLTEDYVNLLKNGWQGAMAWSSNNPATGDGMGGMESIGPAARHIAEHYPELVFPFAATKNH
jgi:hypothetical protein